ncbi:unnamed protein product [Calypogeia fissa]
MFDSLTAIFEQSFEQRMSRLEAAHKVEIEAGRAATDKALNDALILRSQLMAYENNNELVEQRMSRLENKSELVEQRLSRLEAAYKAEIEVEQAATDKALNDAIILRSQLMAYENNSKLEDCIATWNEEMQKLQGLKTYYEKLVFRMSTMIENGEKGLKEAEIRADWIIKFTFDV